MNSDTLKTLRQVKRYVRKLRKDSPVRLWPEHYGDSSHWALSTVELWLLREIKKASTTKRREAR